MHFNNLGRTFIGLLHGSESVRTRNTVWRESRSIPPYKYYLYEFVGKMVCIILILLNHYMDCWKKMLDRTHNIKFFKNVPTFLIPQS